MSRGALGGVRHKATKTGLRAQGRHELGTPRDPRTPQRSADGHVCSAVRWKRLHEPMKGGNPMAIYGTSGPLGMSHMGDTAWAWTPVFVSYTWEQVTAHRGAGTARLPPRRCGSGAWPALSGALCSQEAGQCRRAGVSSGSRRTPSQPSVAGFVALQL